MAPVTQDSSPPATHSSRLQLKTYLMIMIMIIFGPLGNVLLGMGMKHLSHGSSTAAGIPSLIAAGIGSGIVWLGIASLLAFFVANILVLSWADYSFVQPAASLAYVVVAVMSRFILHETVTPLRWAGVAVICIGVTVIGRTPARTTGGAS